jgi:hypothetical protein
MSTPVSQRTFDELLDALGHVQRRKLLLALTVHNPRNDDPAVIDEDESAGEELTRLVAMQHVHLPKLERYGFIEWDQDTNQVSKGPNFDEIRPLLKIIDDHVAELPNEWV